MLKCYAVGVTLPRTICPLTRPNDCVDITHLRTCVNGQVTSTDCGIGKVCYLGQCVPNMT